MKTTYSIEKPHKPKPPIKPSRFSSVSTNLTHVTFTEYVDYLRKSNFSDDYIRNKLARFLTNYRTDIDNMSYFAAYNIFSFVEFSLQDILTIKNICPKNIILNKDICIISGLKNVENPNYHIKTKLYDLENEQYKKDLKNYKKQLVLWESNKKEFELKVLNLEKSLNKE